MKRLLLKVGLLSLFLIFIAPITAGAEIQDEIDELIVLAEQYSSGEISEFDLHYQWKKKSYEGRKCSFEINITDIENSKTSNREFDENGFPVPPSIQAFYKLSPEEKEVIRKYETLVEQRLENETESLEAELQEELKRLEEAGGNENRERIIKLFEEHDKNNKLEIWRDIDKIDARVIVYYSLDGPRRTVIEVRFDNPVSDSGVDYKIMTESHFQMSEDSAHVKDPLDRVDINADLKANEEEVRRCVSLAKEELTRFREMGGDEKKEYVLKELSTMMWYYEGVPSYSRQHLAEGAELDYMNDLGNNIQFTIKNGEISFLESTMIFDWDDGFVDIYAHELYGKHDILIKIDPYFLVDYNLFILTEPSVFSIGSYLGKAVLTNKISIKPFWKITKIVTAIKFLDQSGEFYQGIESTR